MKYFGYQISRRLLLLAMLAVVMPGCNSDPADRAGSSSGLASESVEHRLVDADVAHNDVDLPESDHDGLHGRAEVTESVPTGEQPAVPGREPVVDSAETTDPEVNGARDEPETSTDAAAKKPQGTKLPTDLLEGSKLTPLNPQGSVLLDLEGKRVLLRSHVCLRRGLLEMLLCPHQTKEHESVLSTKASAYTVHTGLLALGCKEGQAARYDPETNVYSPARGQVIDIFLHWVDVDGKLHRERAQNWVRQSRQRYYEAKFETLPLDLKLETDGNLRYDDMNKVIFWYGPMDEQQRDECLKLSADSKFQAAIQSFHKDSQEQPMSADWVFVGSGFYQDGDSAKQYLAEGGYMICVANFAMAMIDIATPSDSNGTESLAYEAATERIPPRESEVLIELVPRPETNPAEENAVPPATDAPATIKTPLR